MGTFLVLLITGFLAFFASAVDLSHHILLPVMKQKKGYMVAEEGEIASDPSSCANLHEITTNHLGLDFDVKPSQKKMGPSSVTLEMEALKSGVKQVVLDFDNIKINQALMLSSKERSQLKTVLKFTEDQMGSSLGKCLTIVLPQALKKKEVASIQIRFESIDSHNRLNQALSWLEASQTSGKKLPYMYSQCQSILCRQVFPHQDSPSVRVTYDARVVVDAPLVAKMSANLSYVETLDTVPLRQAFYFKCSIPIPSYLVAIAVGDLQEKQIGERVAIISEPSELERISEEFSALQSYLDQLESQLTPFIWGQFKILVLPPSFPFGGMEHPLLTYASPSIITGDKSQVDTVIHEIAHMWTGNSLTCKTWTDFWINEALTVYEQRKAQSKLGKDPAAAHEVFMAQSLLGNFTMVGDIEKYGADHPFTALHVKLDDKSPEDSYSNIPYEKGFQFIFFLESLIGEQQMLDFIRVLVQKYALKSITSTDFRAEWDAYITTTLTPAKKKEVSSKVDWDTWLYSPGMPPVQLNFETKKSQLSYYLADRYVELDGKVNESPKHLEAFKDMSSFHRQIFLERLLQRIQEVSPAILTKIDTDLGLTQTKDPELKKRWLNLAAKKQYQPAYTQISEFLSETGKTKYIYPIYETLGQTGQFEFAIKILKKNWEFYHNIVIEPLSRILGVDGPAQPQDSSLLEKASDLY